MFKINAIHAPIKIGDLLAVYSIKAQSTASVSRDFSPNEILETNSILLTILTLNTRLIELVLREITRLTGANF